MAELERMLAAGELPRLGAGQRRECFVLPGADLCLKCYRRPEDVTDATIRREILRFAHDEKRNTCCQEYRYHQELKKRLPSHVLAAFPEMLEQVYLPTRGWCLIESRILNPEGGAPDSFAQAYCRANEAVRAALLAEFWALVNGLADQRVRFYDAQNIIVQRGVDGRVILRIVDFEPCSRTMVPIDLLFPGLVRMKVLRRARRYLWTQLGLAA